MIKMNISETLIMGSPRYGIEPSYPDPSDCTYTITAPSGAFITVEVTKFDLKGSCSDFISFDGGKAVLTILESIHYVWHEVQCKSENHVQCALLRNSKQKVCMQWC